ncbi:nitroreductase [Pseudomonas saliphila]|uniref:nitroreductase n=1 Tax=Pseudomonas saliphila TaxID=2586906 RepID=UPI001239EBF8|nr:nitroreductase [Pseudomonas saliphila]
MKKETALPPSHGTQPFDQVIFKRRSVRGFLPDEVPDDRLQEVFALAQQTPSNCNVQPWIVHVVSGQARNTLQEGLLAAARFPENMHPDWPVDIKYEGVHRERQFDAAIQLYGAMGVERQDMAGRNEAFLRNFAFFDAPHVAFIFLPVPFDVRQATDCGMYAQTLMLAMTSRGIDSCAQGALTLYPDLVREQLGISAQQRLLLGISFGYEDIEVKANAARVGRGTLSQSVRFHR